MTWETSEPVFTNGSLLLTVNLWQIKESNVQMKCNPIHRLLMELINMETTHSILDLSGSQVKQQTTTILDIAHQHAGMMQMDMTVQLNTFKLSHLMTIILVNQVDNSSLKSLLGNMSEQ